MTMIHRNIIVEAPKGALYSISFTSEKGSQFIRIIVKEVMDEDENRPVISATVKWHNYKTIRFYGHLKARNFTSLLGAIERELSSLMNDNRGFSNVVLN